MAGLAAATVFWCGITGVFTYHTLRSIRRHFDARNRFVATEGEVLAGRIKTSSDGDGATHTPIIRYRYVVGGVEYISDRYAYWAVATSDYAHVSRIVRDHPKGRKVTVYYDPDNPADAILQLEVPTAMYFLLLFLQPFLLIGLGLIAMLFWTPFNIRRIREFLTRPLQIPCRVPTWGMLRREMGAVVIQPGGRLSNAFRGGVIAYGAVCFAGIFVVGFLFEGFGAPDPRAIAGAFLLATAAGVLYFVVCFSRGGGKARLAIDTGLGRVTLTSPKRNADLAFSEIRAWTLSTITNPRKLRRQGDPAEVPLLGLSAADGRELPLRAFTTDDYASHVSIKVAHEFAALTGHPLVPLAPANDEAQGGPKAPSRPASTPGEDYSDLT